MAKMRTFEELSRHEQLILVIQYVRDGIAPDAPSARALLRRCKVREVEES